LKEKGILICTFAAMKKLLLLILFVLNLVLLQAQEVKFISVNSSIDTLENISFKRLPKLLASDTLRPNTLSTPAKWMLKLGKKLSKQQRQDSNIYIFFIPSAKDSLKAYLPLSGKYGYVLFDTAKTRVVEVEKVQLRLSTHKYQWDLIHDPEAMVFAFMQDESEGAYYEATTTDIWNQNVNNIACANYNNQTQVEIEGVGAGLKGAFTFGDIGRIGLEIPETAASQSDKLIDLTSLKTTEKTNYNDGSKYLEIVYKSVSGKYRIFFDVPIGKKTEFLGIINSPEKTYFETLISNIPKEESQEAYSKLVELPVCSYEKISISSRIKYFEWLSGELWTNTDQEVIILDLLTHAANRQELYNELYKRPVLVAKLMLACDGDNRQKFIDEITKLCDESWAANAQAKGNVYIGTVPSSFGSFYSGNDFITYAILSEGSSTCSVSNYIGRFPKGMFDWGNVQVLKPLSEFSCNPLDPVAIYSSNGAEGLFPLLYPVNLSQQHGNQQVMQQFAATLNYIGVASSVRMLATGSRFAKSIAIVELTKTGLDLIFEDPQVIQALNATEDGKQFLKYWQIASVTIDVATIGADVLEGMIKHGPEASKALRAAGKNDAADNVDDIVLEAQAVKVNKTAASLKFWKKKVDFQGVKVYQRDDLFEPNKMSTWTEKGKPVTGTNIQRMSTGRAPVDANGESINLHHLIQIDGEGLVEVTADFHQKYYSILHINPNTIPSGINRSTFNTYKSNYWKNRATNF